MTEKEREPEPLSEIEQIRLKSVDPDFLHECDVTVKHNREVRQEKEYAALLKQRAADDVELRNRARVGFEAECD